MLSCFRPFFGTLGACLLLLTAAAPAYAQQKSQLQAAASELPDAPSASRDASKTSGSEQIAENRAGAASAPSADGPANTDPDSATPARLGGTVTDTNGDIVPGATVTLDGPTPADHKTTTSDDNAGFEFNDLKPG